MGFVWLLTLALPLLIQMPASNRSRSHKQKDDDRNEGKPDAMDGTLGNGPAQIAVSGRVLLGDQPDIRSRLAGGSEIFGDCLFFVDAYIFSVRPNIAFIEDAARKRVELLFLQRAKQAGANLGDRGNVVERDAAHLALPPQAFAEPACARSGLFK